MMKTNRIFKICIPQTVKKRKYEVDIIKLQQILRNHKSESKLTNKQISEILNKPLTLVEHWFRTDNYFAIPDEDIWFNLKNLLCITTNEFDRSIMEFTYEIGVYEKTERCYLDIGIAPTITSVGDGEKVIITCDDY